MIVSGFMEKLDIENKLLDKKKQYNRQYYINHREEILEKAKIYRYTHNEQILAKAIERREKLKQSKVHIKKKTYKKKQVCNLDCFNCIFQDCILLVVSCLSFLLHVINPFTASIV